MKKIILVSFLLITTGAASFGQCNLFLNSTNDSCNLLCDGTARANAFGGTSPYTFAWLPAGQTTSAIAGLCTGTYTCNLTDAIGCTKTSTVTITQPAVLGVNTTVTAATSCGPCNGSVHAVVSGGTTTYTYNWAPSGGNTANPTGLCAGNYTLTVIDKKKCTVTTTVSIGGPTGPTTVLSSTNVSCNGTCDGTSTANVSGGTSPYTYLWAPGGATTSSVTGLCSGNHTVTVSDAGGCFSPSVINITQPLVLNTAGARTNASCNGVCDGTANVTPSGGTPSYSYLWSSGQSTSAVTGLCANNYTVTVTDAHGCTIARTYTVTQPSSIGIAMNSNPAASCIPCNGNASATVNGGTPPYIYSWAPSGGNSSAASGLCAGNYTVTVTDSHTCVATSTVSVGGTAGPMTSISSSTNIVCNGSCTGSATSSASGGTLPYTFVWSDGQSTQTASGLCAGNSTVTISDAGGCYSSAIVTITQPATALSTTVTPTNASCNGVCNGKASVKASGGTSPYTYLWSSGGTTTAVTGLCANIYSITVTDSKGCSVVNSYTVSQPASMGIASSLNNATSCAPCDGSASGAVVGGTAPYTYAWSPSGGNSSAASGLCPNTYTLTVTDSKSCTSTTTVGITGPMPPSVSTASVTNASCNGTCDGSSTAIASGGTQPYTYAWSPSTETDAIATALCSGTNTVLVTESGGCSSTATVSITQPSTLSGARSHTNVFCNGNCTGTATVVASGGTSPYTYSWAPSGGNSSAATGLCAGNYTVTITDAHACTLARTYTVTQPSSVGIATNSTPASTCSPCDGSASLTVNGGTLPYAYAWSPSGGNSSAASGLCAGTYTATITDANSCASTSTVSVGGSSGPAGSISSTNVSCNSACDGTASVTGSGGTLPYTYAWSPSGGSASTATGLCAGNYTVTLSDANGCYSSSMINITQPNTLNGTANQVNATCNNACDGKANISASGGTAPYTYSWSLSGGTGALATGLCAGNYTLTVTDSHGCALTHTYTITQPSSIGITTTFSNATSCTPCNGGASATAVGGVTPYSYSWSPSGGNSSAATGLCAGNYTVTVTDGNSCTSTNTVIVGGPAGPTVSVTVNSSSATANATGNSPFGYSWSDGQSTQTATGLQTGTYTVCITDAGGCTTCTTVNISLTGVANLSADNYVNIYPNPANEFIFVEASFSTPQTVNISILNIIGQTMMSEQVSSGIYMNKKVYIGDLRQGIYFIEIRYGNTIKNSKIVKIQ